MLAQYGVMSIMNAFRRCAGAFYSDGYVQQIKGIAMKKLIALACLGFAVVASSPAFAGAQQEKMKGCNAEAKADALKGADRKAFMSKCLKKDYVLKSGASAAPAAAPAVAPATQQNKMKNCNADAKTQALQGEERKTFMKTCLKK